jgi:hypothetical protein
MHADSYFALGSTHDVCQDYALAGDAHGYAFGVVADGCSSSPHTDFGARLLAYGAQSVMLAYPSRLHRLGILPLACTSLGHLVPSRCLDATLMAVYDADGFISAHVAGDGVVVARRLDGTHEVHEIEFSGNAPAYLSYQLDGSRLAALIGEDGPGGVREVTSSALAADFTQTEQEWINDGAIDGDDPNSYWWWLPFSVEEYDLVAVMTDGAQSFQRRAGGALEPVPLNEVLREVLAFKGMKGRFVARRLKRFLGRYCAEHGWSHADDFAVAAIYAGG